MPPQMNISELYSLQNRKKKLRTVSFDHIIILVHKRIKNVSSYGGLNTFYEVPGMVVGLPLFDIVECTSYIVAALRKNGFLVQLLPPPHYCVIYISWNPTDVKKPPPTQPSISHSSVAKGLKSWTDTATQLRRLF